MGSKIACKHEVVFTTMYALVDHEQDFSMQLSKRQLTASEHDWPCPLQSKMPQMVGVRHAHQWPIWSCLRLHESPCLNQHTLQGNGHQTCLQKNHPPKALQYLPLASQRRVAGSWRGINSLRGQRNIVVSCNISLILRVRSVLQLTSTLNLGFIFRSRRFPIQGRMF